MHDFTEDRPARVAIIGSGPSGFFAAEALFRSPIPVRVDLFDRLPTPYGLVRGGVAPDHPKIKAVIAKYEKIAGHAGFAFLGNVTLGEDVTLEDLRRFYDAVLLTTGAESDRRLGIPGEDLLGSHTATELVGWYNGHPDYKDRVFDFQQEVAVVVGQGNVAMDVTRVLAKTVDELKHTDIAAHALEALAASRIKEIHLVGRRGPAQVKFTPPEIRELGELTDCDPVVSAQELELEPASALELEHKDSKGLREAYAILQAFAARAAPCKGRRIFIHFRKSPLELSGEDRLREVLLGKNRLDGPPFEQRAVDTGELETLPCGLLFRSVGYRGVALEGVPFDERRGAIPHEGGRVVSDGKVVPGLYAAGWIKRGPSGVIGSNKPCAVETVGALLEDLPSLRRAEVPDTGALLALLGARGVRVVSFEDWLALDAVERERGAAAGKPREKLTSIEEMLRLLPSR
jgi:ferredoxin/flavodoxin---NADP+ reductase